MGSKKTPEAAASLERAKAELEACIARCERKLPFDLQTAGATRIDAFKAAMAHGRKVLQRGASQGFKYDDARLRIESVGTKPLDALAKDFLKPEAPTGARP